MCSRALPPPCPAAPSSLAALCSPLCVLSAPVGPPPTAVLRTARPPARPPGVHPCHLSLAARLPLGPRPLSLLLSPSAPCGLLARAPWASGHCPGFCPRSCHGAVCLNRQLCSCAACAPQMGARPSSGGKLGGHQLWWWCGQAGRHICLATRPCACPPGDLLWFSGRVLVPGGHWATGAVAGTREGAVEARRPHRNRLVVRALVECRGLRDLGCQTRWGACLERASTCG